MTIVLLFAIAVSQVLVWIEIRLIRDAVLALTRTRDPAPSTVSSVPTWNCTVKVRGKSTKVQVQAASESAAVRELITLGYREAIEKLERVS